MEEYIMFMFARFERTHFLFSEGIEDFSDVSLFI